FIVAAQISGASESASSTLPARLSSPGAQVSGTLPGSAASDHITVLCRAPLGVVRSSAKMKFLCAHIKRATVPAGQSGNSSNVLAVLPSHHMGESKLLL